MLDQHCIGMLFSQCYWNTSETTLHKKYWIKAGRYTFAVNLAVSDMPGSLFLTGHYITEQFWVFLFNVGLGVYLWIAGQQWTGADIDWNIHTKPLHYFSVGRFRPPGKYSYEIGRSFADPLTVHSLYPSIKSSHTKKIVFALYFNLKLSCESSLLNQCILVANPF